MRNECILKVSYLVDYFNGHLFTAGDDGVDERRRMMDEERRLLDAIEGDSGDEESDDHDDHGRPQWQGGVGVKSR
jgi:hypothetical protein